MLYRLADRNYNRRNYNQSCVKLTLVFRPLMALLAIGIATLSPAQQSSSTASEPASRGHLILVLPFENKSGEANIDWMSESMPEIINRRLDSAGFLPIGREDRLYALDHLGLPPDFRPSRASTIRLAQNLDADSVILGTYTSDGKRLTIRARILDVSALRLSAPVEAQVDMPRLLDGINSVAWQLVRQIEPAYPVAQQTFVAADANLPLAAFENYIRGLVESTPVERAKHLQEAVRIDPTYYPAWLALGRLYFHEQEYELAAAAFGKIPSTDSGALDAAFDRGLASFYTGNYVLAEESFAFVAMQLPLSEVINNQAVASSRRNRDAVALFQQAVNTNPKDADYHFNLALALRRRNDIPGAMHEAGECLKLRPQDAEAQALLASLQNTATNSAVKTNVSASTTSNPDGPLERIKRTYDQTAFRQAAYEIDQMEGMKLATQPPAARSEALTAAGNRYLNSGLLLEAERQFQSAITADPTDAAAHAGLAEVRERSGDAKNARLEAQQSLQLKPNVEGHVVLAQLDLQSGQLSSAAGEVSQALQLDPKNATALGLRQALQSKGQQVQ
jgi:tetratricopeptide (TPR) repeat protein/TolB-like protein